MTNAVMCPICAYIVEVPPPAIFSPTVWEQMTVLVLVRHVLKAHPEWLEEGTP